MSRYTERDVNNAFGWFVQASKDAGLDTTGWVLHSGNSSYGYNWRIQGPRGQIGLPLGTTKREAYSTLRHMWGVLDLVNGPK